MRYEDVHGKELSNNRSVYDLIINGKIIVIRNLNIIKIIRNTLIDYALLDTKKKGLLEELEDFYVKGDIPSIKALADLSRAIKKASNDRYLSQVLSDTISNLCFEEPVLLGTGISRLVLPETVVQQAKKSVEFSLEDFERKMSDGPVETFMQEPSNIHRDVNREHRFFMCNLWFPLHDVSASEVVQLFPYVYKQPVYDMDNIAENYAVLGEKLQIALNYGDALLFHGEHMHVSPSPDTRRHSYDFRIVCACIDDNKHYRYNFSNINNFYTKSDNRQIFNFDYKNLVNIKEHHAENNRYYSANFYRTWLNKLDANSISISSLKAIHEIYKTYPFAEDRYIELAIISRNISTTLSESIIRYVVDQSSSYYWLLKCTELLMEYDNNKIALLACRKAKNNARNIILRNYAPVKYENSATQLMPDQAMNLSRHYMRKIRKNNYLRIFRIFGIKL